MAKNNADKRVLTPQIMRERALTYARQEEQVEIQGEMKQFLEFHD